MPNILRRFSWSPVTGDEVPLCALVLLSRAWHILTEYPSTPSAAHGVLYWETNMKPLIKMILVPAALMALALASTAHAQVDNSLYAELLTKYNKDGLVDYKGLMTEKDKLERYLEILSQVDADALPPDEQYAYYINAYNAWTLKLILDNYPVDSIKDIGGLFSSPWKIEFVRLKNGTVHLDNVEHDILRPRFKDARVHFAVNCASLGCPLLYDKPFEGATLDATLEKLTREHINDPNFTYLKGDDLFVSKVFDWFGGDWGDEDAKVAFVLQYAKPDFKQKIEAQGNKLDLKYAHWDWDLNEAK